MYTSRIVVCKRIVAFLWLMCLMISAEEVLQAKKRHHMENQIPRATFVKKAKSLGTDQHELVFAVQQKNIDELERRLLEASTPGSPKYLQWMTYEEVHAISSNPVGAEVITAWLESNGCEVVKATKHKDYITAVASIGTWESLLDTEFFEWEDETFTRRQPTSYAHAKGKRIHRAQHYSIPAELKPHLFTVFNTVQTPPPYKPTYSRRPGTAGSDGQFKTNLRMRPMASAVTPDFLNSAYRIEHNEGSAELSQSVFETNEETYSPADLTAFQDEYGLPEQAAEAPYGFANDDCTNNHCTEGNLDIQYIMAVAQQTVTIYWYQDGSNSDPFVAWITDVADESNPPQSNSISWGSPEPYVSDSTMDSFQTEAIKLANMGVTVVVSSGDSGAPNILDSCLCSGVSDSGLTSNGYNPSFPASCPYVTAVGGTMGPENGDDEVVCDSNNGGVITSGGGFSTHFAAPSWQSSITAAYLAANPPVAGYSASGRGFPDISFIAVNYQVMIENSLATVFGTSASAPVFAGFVSLVNAARLNASLSSIGFLNPTLYAVGSNSSSPHKFNDVVSGNNKCCQQSDSGTVTCCGTGFVAATGWDPTTGWGSMNYDTFSAVYEVATPYSGSGSGKKKTSWQVILIAVLIILAAISCLCCLCGFIFNRSRRSRQEEHVTHATVVTRTGSNDHAVAMQPVYVQHNNRV